MERCVDMSGAALALLVLAGFCALVVWGALKASDDGCEYMEEEDDE